MNIRIQILAFVLALIYTENTVVPIRRYYDSLTWEGNSFFLLHEKPLVRLEIMFSLCPLLFNVSIADFHCRM